MRSMKHQRRRNEKKRKGQRKRKKKGKMEKCTSLSERSLPPAFLESYAQAAPTPRTRARQEGAEGRHSTGSHPPPLLWPLFERKTKESHTHKERERRTCISTHLPRALSGPRLRKREGEGGKKQKENGPSACACAGGYARACVMNSMVVVVGNTQTKKRERHATRGA